MKKSKSGILFVVGTPIGNMEDISFRAIKTLKSVDLILCEDTRTTGNLLKKYEIKTSTMSYHAKSTISKIDEIIHKLEEGRQLALVSDAGTPGISDPGNLLVSKIHELNLQKKEEEKLKIIVIPGSSALIAALSISGFTGGSFIFQGFLPHKKGRETIFKKIKESAETYVFYESPHRIIKTLESLIRYIPDRRIMIARELTKIYEETLIGKPEEVLEILNKKPEKIRGEFVVIVYPK
jgi:16S rRNA (cytidine1402-2'-O)-methyltransferase